MIRKELFCRAMKTIKRQEDINQYFMKATQAIGNGYVIQSLSNPILDMLLLVLKEETGDKYDYIQWWLYEATADHTVRWENEGKVWALDTPEALYDYITKEAIKEAKQ